MPCTTAGSVANILDLGGFSMRIRRFLSLLSVGILAGLAGLSAVPRAALSDAEVFRVSGVPVDATAVTAAQARDTGHALHEDAQDVLAERTARAEQFAKHRRASAAPHTTTRAHARSRTTTWVRSWAR